MTTLNIKSTITENTPLIIGVREQEDETCLAVTNIGDEQFVTAVTAGLNTLKASTKVGAVTTLFSPIANEQLVIAVGLGEDPTLEDLRQAAGAGVMKAAGMDTVTLSLPNETNAELEALSEGALLGAYAFNNYLPEAKKPVTNIDILSENTTASEAIIARANIVTTAVNRVRDLTNTPANDLNPEKLAAVATAEAKAVGCKVKVYAGEELHSEKLSGLLAVGSGSASKPRLVRIEWNPADAQGFVALVGKGITFDTGGYSLKPSNFITEMKTDMGGAATIMETIVAAATLKLPIKLVGWMCLAENMVSSTAGRPDDVITYRNGKSVEINNTDAEGRLVMADGLIMATEENPDVVIDVATLTGAQMISLGERTVGVMGTPEIRDAVVEAADKAGEMTWAMPLPEHLKSSLKSDIADMVNTGSRSGGMLTAGLFLKEFTADTPWAHIDIAGPSFNREGAYGYTPKGATGVMVRTLVEYLENKIQ